MMCQNHCSWSVMLQRRDLGVFFYNLFLKWMKRDIVNASNMSDFLSDLKPVPYASKSLSDCRNLLCQHWEGTIRSWFWCWTFQTLYIWSSCTHIITDHKPLLPLFEKSFTNTTHHLSRLLLCISEYDLKLHYQPGSKMTLSDALSRQSSHNTKDGNNTEVKGLDISIHAPRSKCNWL